MDIGKILLIGAGGFILYEVFFAAAGPVAAAVPPAATSAGTAQPQNTPSPMQINRSVDTTTLSRVAAAAFPATMLNFDQWNYYYQKATGIPGPDPNGLGANRSALISIGQWAAYLSGSGSALPASGYTATPAMTSRFNTVTRRFGTL